VLKEVPLDNGLMLEITDESYHDHVDFWHLKVVITGTVKVTAHHLQTICPSTPHEEEAKEALGSEAAYHRELTRRGV
jgi:hypothetical protein